MYFVCKYTTINVAMFHSLFLSFIICFVYSLLLVLFAYSIVTRLTLRLVVVAMLLFDSFCSIHRICERKQNWALDGRCKTSLFLFRLQLGVDVLYSLYYIFEISERTCCCLLFAGVMDLFALYIVRCCSRFVWIILL